MTTWFDDNVVAPVEDILAQVEVGGAVSDQDVLERLATPLEGLFRSELRTQWSGWPPESTTDGCTVNLATRTGRRSIEVSGLMWINFDGAVLAYRAQLTLTAERTAHAIGYVEVDPSTDGPAHRPGGTIMVLERDEGGRLVPQLIVGRNQHEIVWTKVFEIPETAPAG